MTIFEPYSVLLAVATNAAVLLKTGSEVTAAAGV